MPCYPSWECKDRRYLIKLINSTDEPVRRLYATCDWYEKYDILPTDLECVLTFCDNATLLPNISNNYALDWNNTEESLILLNQDLVYPCMEDMKLENNTSYKENATSYSLVRCGMDGMFRYPDTWTLCSDTVQCGQPPNATDAGYRTWVLGGYYGVMGLEDDLVVGDDYYLAEVEYGCVNGSQFDTDNNGFGDSYRIINKCLWNQTWSPYPELPDCKITHCVDPFDIPDHTMLEEKIHNTVSWTRVGQNKTYRCQGILDDGTHTRFFEHDRSLSEFNMLCLPDGTFDFDNKTENWPVCLEGTLHNKFPLET